MAKFTFLSTSQTVKGTTRKLSTTTIEQNNIHPWKKANSKHIKSSYLNYVLQDRLFYGNPLPVT